MKLNERFLLRPEDERVEAELEREVAQRRGPVLARAVQQSARGSIRDLAADVEEMPASLRPRALPGSRSFRLRLPPCLQPSAARPQRTENGTDRSQRVPLAGICLVDKGAEWPRRKRDLAGAPEPPHLEASDAKASAGRWGFTLGGRARACSLRVPGCHGRRRRGSCPNLLGHPSAAQDRAKVGDGAEVGELVRVGDRRGSSGRRRRRSRAT